MLHLTPETLESSYRLLCTTLPFRRWKLPDSDNIAFVVSMHHDRLAHHRPYKDGSGRHEIAISARKVKTLALLNECMAHEMVHIRQDQLGIQRAHGAAFKRLAALVCRRHGWTLATF